MNTKPGRIAWIILAVALLAALGGIVLVLRDRPDIRPVTDEEEEAAANALFADRFSGPGYFQAASPDGWIDHADAYAQVPEIAKARNLDAGAVTEVGRLIERMTEPHPYRSVGGGRLKASRLNLALDGK